MQNTGNWNPPLHQPVKLSERNAAALAALEFCYNKLRLIRLFGFVVVGCLLWAGIDTVPTASTTPFSFQCFSSPRPPCVLAGDIVYFLGIFRRSFPKTII